MPTVDRTSQLAGAAFEVADCDLKDLPEVHQ